MVHLKSRIISALRGALCGVVICIPQGFAASWRADSCSRADVGSALLKASDGDEVVIPSGTCAWTETLVIDRSVTLRGAGQDLTVLRDDVPKISSVAKNLILVQSAPRVRLTHFSVEGVAVDSVNNNYGHILVQTISDLRIDHLTFREQKMPSIIINGGTGVIDHCTFDTGDETAVSVAHYAWDGGWYGDTSWASPATMGTADAIFVEDCEFTGSYITAGPHGGGRMVVRHSTFNGGMFFASGTDWAGRYRGFRHLELYSNRFNAVASIYAAVVVGGGTGVITNNQFEGPFTGLMRFQVLRASRAIGGAFGVCDGGNPFDLNSDAGQVCLDQIGRGQGDVMSEYDPVPQAWPNEVLDPLYIWDNSTDSGVSWVVNEAPELLELGRDWVEGVPRPGYQPFQYPHPLVAAERDAGSEDVGDGGTDGGVDARPQPPVRYAVACSGCQMAPFLCLWPWLFAALRRSRRLSPFRKRL